MLPTKTSTWMDKAHVPPSAELFKRIKEASSFISDPWNDVGQQPILKIWRITKFRAIHWPEEEYGTFYDGEVYIVLNTRYKDVMSANFIHDVHLWLGKKAKSDEVHAGIKKLLELDERLQQESIIHRQVSGREDNIFRQYFDIITVYRGSASDSYRYNPNDVHTARLMRFYKPSRREENYRVKEISPYKSNLQPEYNYILDIGNQIFLWAGNMVTLDEKLKAIHYCEGVVAQRGMRTTLEILDEDNAEDHYFHFYLQNNTENLVDSDDETTSNVTRQATKNRRRPSDIHAFKCKFKSGDVEFQNLKGGPAGFKKQDLATQQGTCVIDTGFDCFVWLGKKPLPQERRNAVFLSHVYLHRTVHPQIPVTVLKDGQTCPAFTRAMSSP